MKYMVIETFKPGQKSAVYERLRERGRMLPENPPQSLPLQPLTPTRTNSSAVNNPSRSRFATYGLIGPSCAVHPQKRTRSWNDEILE